MPKLVVTFLNAGLALLLVAWSPWVTADKSRTPGAFQENEGRLAPLSQPFDLGGRLLPQGRLPQVFDHLLHAPLGDEVRILPKPLILQDDELETLRRGMAQRGLALRRLFEDLIQGNPRLFTGSPTRLTKQTVFQILSDSGIHIDMLAAAYKNHRKIHFVYGPDVMRNREGQWVVVEDNVGFIGGLGDVFAIHRAFTKTYGLRGDNLEGRTYADFVRPFLEIESAKRNLFTVEVSAREDLETVRQLKSIQSLAGVSAVDVFESGSLDISKARRLLRSPVVVSLNRADRYLFEHNRPNPSTLEILRNSTTRFMNGVGVTYLGNKMLLPHMEDLVRFYLHEEPILKTISSQHVTPAMLEQIVAHDLPAVIKRSNSAQGAHVHIFPKMTRREQRKFLDETLTPAVLGQRQIRGNWIVQTYVQPSQLQTVLGVMDVNLRLFGYPMNESEFFVAPMTWGRAAPTNGDGVNNQSRGAYEIAVYSESEMRALLGENIPENALPKGQTYSAKSIKSFVSMCFEL